MIKEKRIIKRIAAGDEKALELLIDIYSSYVGSVIYAVIGRSMTREDIEETAADVFTEVWLHPEKLREGKVKQFLGAVARNTARNKLRERDTAISIDENDFLLFDDSFESEVDRHEKSEIINDALKTLSDAERDIFIRFYYYNQTSKMISESLCIPVSTVTTRLSRGRKKMKDFMAQKGWI